MKFKTLAVPATLAATSAFAGAANATTAIDMNVNVWAWDDADITIGANPTAQYHFGPGYGGKAYITGMAGSLVAAPGSSAYSDTVKTNGSGYGNGDYGLKFAINGTNYQGLATVDNSGEHISRIQASAVAAAVPEPATWATMILGLGVAGAAVRRRRQSAAATAA